MCFGKFYFANPLHVLWWVLLSILLSILLHFSLFCGFSGSFSSPQLTSLYFLFNNLINSWIVHTYIFTLFKCFFVFESFIQIIACFIDDSREFISTGNSKRFQMQMQHFLPSIDFVNILWSTARIKTRSMYRYVWDWQHINSNLKVLEQLLHTEDIWV